MHPVMQSIFDAFERRGLLRYGAEDVNQLQHALQSAQLAVEDSASPALVSAALLHDIGHILSDAEMPGDCRQNLDDQHESVGYQFLKNHFGPAVADPVRLHVVAKRYLCTTEPGYVDRLSPTSLKSYEDQGGAMSAEQRRKFEAEPYFEDAVRLRRWDDAAKDASATTPRLEDFAHYLETTLASPT